MYSKDCISFWLIWTMVYSKEHVKETFYLLVLIFFVFQIISYPSYLYNDSRNILLGLLDIIILVEGDHVGFLLVPGS